MPPICWKNHGKSDNFPIHFECHQGRDRNITKKQKYKETRKDLVRGVDHTEHGVIQLLCSHKMTKIWTTPPPLFALVRFW